MLFSTITDNFKRFLLLLTIITLTFATSGQASDFSMVNRWDKPVGPGLHYYHYKLKIDDQPLQIYIVTAELSERNLEIKPILANDRLDSLETVPSMANRTNAVVAINGSFYNRSASNPFPIGFIMIDQRTVYFSHLNRSAFGLTTDKIPLFGYPATKGIVYLERTGNFFYLWGMNGKRAKNEVLVYTPEYGPNTNTNQYGREVIVARDQVVDFKYGGSAIPEDGFVISMHGDSKKYMEWFQVGDRAKLYFVVDPEWLEVNNALTGGPLMLSGGRKVLHLSKSEKLYMGVKKRIPLTAIGSTTDGRLMLVVADGRQRNYSVGVTYEELADFMLSIGAVNAIGMDGGGSSTLWINGQVMNRISDGAPRPVANALGIFYH